MTTRNALNLELIQTVGDLAMGSTFGPNGRFMRVPSGGALQFAARDLKLSTEEPVCFGASLDSLVAHCNQRMAFEAVQNEAHWKGAVDAIINAEHAEIVAAAIECFTATKATVTPVGSSFAHVKAAGYWAGPAA